MTYLFRSIGRAPNAIFLFILNLTLAYRFCLQPPEISTLPAPNTKPSNDCANHIKSKAQTCIYRPAGTRLGSISVRNGGAEEVAVFLPIDFQPAHTQHVIIMIHGKLSDAGLYWERLKSVTTTAHDAGFFGLTRNITLVAPLLFSDSFTPGLSGPNQLTWARPDDWMSGFVANRPQTTNLTSIDVLETLVDEFSNRTRYPELTNITFVGQSAGGQLIQRYSAIAKERRLPRPHIRYIHNNPSSSAYFTSDRPKLQNEVTISKDACEDYNLWKSGFDGFQGTSEGLLPRTEYFRRYITRDVVSTIGYLDTDPCSGGQECQEVIQGGRNRRDRNLIWYKYVHELAQTGQDLRGFPGNFSSLPDWGSYANHHVNVRLAVAKTAGHEFDSVFKTKTGMSAIFDDHTILSD